MNLGSDLAVDGKVRANQATQAGECVTLGDDLKIPAELVPSAGGSEWLPATSTNLKDYKDKSAIRVKAIVSPVDAGVDGFAIADIVIEDCDEKANHSSNVGVDSGYGPCVIGGQTMSFNNTPLYIWVNMGYGAMGPSDRDDYVAYKLGTGTMRRCTFVLPSDFSYSPQIGSGKYTVYYKD